ncbi:MAG: s-methyl-5-thioribose-1-phosphate isomerase [Candidatus Heimdallarchaeota archaeon]
MTRTENIVERILIDVGMVFDETLGIWSHTQTRIPVTVWWNEEKEQLVLLDQTKLPFETTIWTTTDWRKAAWEGIKGMVVRGSQAIGAAAGYAVLLAAKAILHSKQIEEFDEFLSACAEIRSTRPTASPLMWAVDRAVEAATDVWREGKSAEDIIEVIKKAADYFLAADLILCQYLIKEGLQYIENKDVIMTHCNGGSLSSSYGGHALGMIEEAHAQGREILVVAKETRPRGQGFKLTTWELNRAGVPVVVVTDNMIGAAFKRYKVKKIILGVDRLAQDGSVANKIGSADLARIAAHFDEISFYYATSYSTIDLNAVGKEVPIEERDQEEILYPYRLEAKDKKERGILSRDALDQWPPAHLIATSEVPETKKIGLFNPAFDITPPGLINLLLLDIGSYAPHQIRTLTDAKIAELVAERLRVWGIQPELV